MQCAGPRPAQPAGHLLAVLAGPVQVVVARRGQHDGLVGEPLQVVVEHDDLHVEGHRAGHVGQVTGEGHDVDVAGGGHQPVVVPKAVVQICDRQDPHRSILAPGRP